MTCRGAQRIDNLNVEIDGRVGEPGIVSLVQEDVVCRGIGHGHLLLLPDCGLQDSQLGHTALVALQSLLLLLMGPLKPQQLLLSVILLQKTHRHA